jgi:hypothetical protein
MARGNQACGNWSARGLPEADPRHRVTIFQVDNGAGFPGGADPPPDRPPEQGQGIGERDDPVLRDLFLLKRDAAENGVVKRTAVKKKTDAARAAGALAAEIHTRQAAALHLEAALFPDLAAAGLPRCLAVGLHHAAGNGPPGLVGRLEDEEPALAVKDHCSG